MADEALRRLEREAAAGDLQAALRYAGALEREGRRGEAACLLRRFPGEKAAQEALARSPVWNHGDLKGGGSRFLDVEPVSTKPRVVWKTTVGSNERMGQAPTQLIASALGVVATTPSALTVLDAGTGETRWERRWGDGAAFTGPFAHLHGVIEIVGSELVAWNGGLLRRRDLVTGAELGAAPAPVPMDGMLAGGTIFANVGEDSIGAWALAEKPSVWLWKDDAPSNPTPRVVAGGRVFARSDTGVVALDAASGRLLWRSPRAEALLGDEAGLATREALEQRTGDFELVLRGAEDGQLHQDLAGLWTPLALSPQFVVAGFEGLYVAFDRAKGVWLQLPSRPPAPGQVAVARDMIYSPRGGPLASLLAACRPDGSLVWQFSMTRGLDHSTPTVKTIAALDRVLIVQLEEGIVAALTDLPESVWPTSD